MAMITGVVTRPISSPIFIHPRRTGPSRAGKKMPVTARMAATAKRNNAADEWCRRTVSQPRTNNAATIVVAKVRPSRGLKSVRERFKSLCEYELNRPRRRRVS